MRGVNHTCMGFLYSTHVYTYMQYLHTRVFTRVHACIATVASYLTFSLSYNATVLVTLLFPTGPWMHTKG